MPKQPKSVPRSKQISVPYPPHRDDSGERRLRREPDLPVQESYRRNIIRLSIAGQSPIDVIPAPKGDTAVRSVDPSSILGGGSPVWIVSGCNAFGRLSTPDEQAATTAVLYEHLDSRGWTWHPVVLMAPGREWVETGAVVLGASQDQIVSKALHHGQEAVLRWDARGIAVITTGLVDDVVDGQAVPVTISPALLGCPLRFGADDVCVRQGGPFGSRAISVCASWEKHRALLVSALGYTVCEGGEVDGNGRPISGVSSFVPSRRGGWQNGPPLSSAALHTAMSDDD